MIHLREDHFSGNGNTIIKSGVSESMVKKKKKNERNKDIYEWGTLFIETVENCQVKNFQSKDNVILIFQSTAHIEKEDIIVRNQ